MSVVYRRSFRHAVLCHAQSRHASQDGPRSQALTLSAWPASMCLARRSYACLLRGGVGCGFWRWGRACSRRWGPPGVPPTRPACLLGADQVYRAPKNAKGGEAWRWKASMVIAALLWRFRLTRCIAWAAVSIKCSPVMWCLPRCLFPSSMWMGQRVKHSAVCMWQLGCLRLGCADLRVVLSTVL